MTDDETQPLRAPATLRELFFAFNRLSLQGFGGVLPVAQRELVERQRWLDKQEFVELLSIGQVLPGPNVVNLALMLGERFFGVRGAVVALVGMLLVPTLIVLALAALYAQFSDVPVVAGALRGMGAVAAGLVLSTGIKLASTLKTNPMGLWPSAALAFATLAAIGVLRWPLVWIVLGLGGSSVAFAWRRLGSVR